MNNSTRPNASQTHHIKVAATKAALNEHLDVPEAVTERLALARRQAVQAFEQKRRSKLSKHWGATPWLAGAGLAVATVSAVVIAPRLTPVAPNVDAMPIELIAAEEDLDFFQNMDYLEWSLTDETTS